MAVTDEEFLDLDKRVTQLDDLVTQHWISVCDSLLSHGNSIKELWQESRCFRIPDCTTLTEEVLRVRNSLTEGAGLLDSHTLVAMTDIALEIVIQSMRSMKEGD